MTQCHTDGKLLKLTWDWLVSGCYILQGVNTADPHWEYCQMMGRAFLGISETNQNILI